MVLVCGKYFVQASANLTFNETIVCTFHIWDSTALSTRSLAKVLKISVLVALLNISLGAVSVKLLNFGQNYSCFSSSFQKFSYEMNQKV